MRTSTKPLTKSTHNKSIADAKRYATKKAVGIIEEARQQFQPGQQRYQLLTDILAKVNAPESKGGK